MTQLADYFGPEVLFSADNPFLKFAAAAHRALFETIDQTAHAQLAFAEALLDINRERFELLYAGKPLSETLDAQQDLVATWGKCAARYAGELREIAESVGAGLSGAMADAANEAVREAERAPRPRPAKSKTAA